MSRRRSIEVPGLHHDTPIPQACVVGNLLVSGGISGADPATGEIPAAPGEQAAGIFANVARVMEAAGGSLEDVVKMTFFVRDRAVRSFIDPEWLKAFPDETSRPARHTLKIDLPPRFEMQAEVIALLG
ncbi:MAG TPA: RidA family protein [Acidimicrobiales bacterium]|nr:RidA family protein [Acidimicrobiales bacterium]